MRGTGGTGCQHSVHPGAAQRRREKKAPVVADSGTAINAGQYSEAIHEKDHVRFDRELRGAVRTRRR